MTGKKRPEYGLSIFVKFTLTDSNSVFYFKLFDFFSDHCIAVTCVDIE